MRGVECVIVGFDCGLIVGSCGLVCGCGSVCGYVRKVIIKNGVDIATRYSLSLLLLDTTNSVIQGQILAKQSLIIPG